MQLQLIQSRTQTVVFKHGFVVRRSRRAEFLIGTLQVYLSSDLFRTGGGKLAYLNSALLGGIERSDALNHTWWRTT